MDEDMELPPEGIEKRVRRNTEEIKWRTEIIERLKSIQEMGEHFQLIINFSMDQLN